MNAEFNWWLLIVGLAVGAGLVWLVLADWSRNEEDVAAEERSAEAAWIAQAMAWRGTPIDTAAAEEVLDLHRTFLRQTSGDAAVMEGDPETGETGDDGWTADEAAPDALGAAPGTAAAGPAAPAETIPASASPPARRERASVRSGPLSPRGADRGDESTPADR
jgi:hypothetical protein